MVRKFFHYDYTEKLSKVLERARAGEEITVGFLGGSITQGCNPSIPENAYAVRTYEWLKTFLAPTKVRYINAGIGATGSLIGAHRMEEDLLQYKPDIIIVEFAANDVVPTDFTRQSYESVIRGVIKKLPDAAVIELFMTLKDGVSAEAQQTQIGHHYKVPMVSFRQEVFNSIAEGKYTWEEVETDEVHPNDKGHEMVALLLQNLFEVADKKVCPEAFMYELPEVLFGAPFTEGMILNHMNLKPLYMGSFEESEEGFKSLKDGWACKMEEENQAFVCKIVAKSIYLLYRRNRGTKCGTVEVTIDYGEKMEVDSSFENGWGDYAEAALILEEKECEEHTIELKLKQGAADESFTILGFLVSRA